MRVAIAALVIGVIAASGCVKITTGPATTAERRSSAEMVAKDIAVDWATSFNPAPLPRKFELIHGFMDTVVVRLLSYGRSIADKWDEANRGRGVPMPSGEMQQIVDRSIEPDRPILEGYEDVIEYSVRTIARDYTGETQVLDELRAQRELYYELYNDVFYPVGEVEGYRERLATKETDWHRQSEHLGFSIRRLGP